MGKDAPGVQNDACAYIRPSDSCELAYRGDGS